MVLRVITLAIRRIDIVDLAMAFLFPLARACVVVTGTITTLPACLRRALDFGPSVSRNGVGFRCVFHSVSLGLASSWVRVRFFKRPFKKYHLFRCNHSNLIQRTSSTPPFGLSLNASYLVLLKRPLRLAAALDTLGIGPWEKALTGFLFF